MGQLLRGFGVVGLLLQDTPVANAAAAAVSVAMTSARDIILPSTD